ncbi:uncharacterized protein LOC124936500 [Impatiens glandulifera]|uniref:uncharacterized protein LOC124936500 n=1 Tax=Impatiens glandulifera TaxID=253017 RepID=UPI001FB0A6E1|nr:uncharacterized protein LOC124936500 [Impatiens glandulifera]
MAFRLAMIRAAGEKLGSAVTGRRYAHISAIPGPLDCSMTYRSEPMQLILPESDYEFDSKDNIGFEFPSFHSGDGSMDLMAVPKKKISKSRRGMRNGPKALSPIPLIIRCKACGRAKLPHFFCCSGERPNMGNSS